jgi:MFS family permease
MTIKASQFFAVILTSLALLPGGAHLMALPAKIAMPEEPYFVVQQIYRGWAWAGAVIFLAIFANILAALLTRASRRKWQLFGAAGLLIAATLAVFFAWTYPANQATGNWTSVPENWEQLRTEWEYSHAANAAITFLALLCSVGAAVSKGPRRESEAGRVSDQDAAARDRLTVHGVTRLECVASNGKVVERIAASERTAAYRRPTLE